MEVINDFLVVIKPNDRLDIHTAETFKENLIIIMQEYPNHNILIDLTNVTSLSSVALRVFISTMKLLAEKNLKLKLVNANPFCEKIIDIVNLSQIIEIYKNMNDAIKSFEEK